MLAEDQDRIARALHPQPHRWLGAQEGKDGPLVRVVDSVATHVRVAPLDGGPWIDATRASAAKGDRAALWVARTPTTWGKLRVQRTLPDGRVVEHIDPYGFSPSIGELDLHLFAEGRHLQLEERLGAHLREHEGVAGTSFTVWAPSALAVRVVGDFNDWQPERGAMRKLAAGVWELFVPGVGHGALYKLQVMTRRGPLDKSDPMGRAMELRPRTASKVWRDAYVWRDDAWLEERRKGGAVRQAMSIYEVHLPSWRRPEVPVAAAAEGAEAPERAFPTYRALAHELVDYAVEMGFTHLELLPVLEHPYDGSWGYQVSGYFAPSSRLGTPEDFKYFVDCCHARGLGVLLDWVPAHFPRDAAALGRFDGTPLYEHWDPRRGEHRQWETFIFDWGRPEVKNFLIASALYWIREFHIDGLRVDAVASMLYLDYGASHAGEWEPNRFGGRENLEAVAFLRALNDAVHENHPGVIVAAEESTAWPGVTRPTYVGGLGFDLKWNMGWMHDTLNYFGQDPLFRSGCHSMITFGLMYAFSERYLLPLSHDEVVHLKRSLYGKMPGDAWQRAATLRALFAHMWAHPGKKLLFMGGELGQTTEWNFSTELEWSVLADPLHAGVQQTVKDLNRLYRALPALHELDTESPGFRWIDANDGTRSVASYLRFGASKLASRNTGTFVVVVGNFTPVVRYEYRVGVPRAGHYLEVLNTDATSYGGSNVGNFGRVRAEPTPAHGFPFSILLTLPPLGVLFLTPEDPGEPTAEELLAEEAERARLEALRLAEAVESPTEVAESELPGSGEEC